MKSFKKFLKEQVLLKEANRSDAQLRERYVPFIWDTFLDFIVAQQEKNINLNIVGTKLIPEMLGLLTEQPTATAFEGTTKQVASQFKTLKQASEVISTFQDIKTIVDEQKEYDFAGNLDVVFILNVIKAMSKGFGFDVKTATKGSSVARYKLSFVGNGDPNYEVSYSQKFDDYISKQVEIQKTQNTELANNKESSIFKMGDFDIGRVPVKTKKPSKKGGENESARRKTTPKTNFTGYDDNTKIAFYEPDKGMAKNYNKLMLKSIISMALDNITLSKDELNTSKLLPEIVAQIGSTLETELSKMSTLDIPAQKGKSKLSVSDKKIELGVREPSEKEKMQGKEKKEFLTPEDEYHKAQLIAIDKIHSELANTLTNVFTNNSSDPNKLLEKEFLRITFTGKDMYEDLNYIANVLMTTDVNGNTAMAKIDDKLLQAIGEVIVIKVSFTNGATGVYTNLPQPTTSAKKRELGTGVQDVVSQASDANDGVLSNESIQTENIVTFLNKEFAILKEDLVLCEIFQDIKDFMKEVGKKISKLIKRVLDKATELFNKGINFFLDFFNIYIKDVVIDGLDAVSKSIYSILHREEDVIIKA